jgi:hypothetical protein
VADQPYTNPFAAVHAKVKIFKDRVSEASRDDAEVRESRLEQEFTKLREKEPE